MAISRPLSGCALLLMTLLKFIEFETLLDQYELLPGDSIYHYMQKIKTEATHVLFIITPDAVQAIEQNTGGVSFEAQLWAALRAEGRLTVIPLLRKGDQTASYVQSHLYIDFRTDNNYNINLGRLVDTINKNVQKPRPGSRVSQRFDGASVKDKIDIIAEVSFDDGESNVVFRLALRDRCRGVVGACLRRLSGTRLEGDLLRGFTPLGMVRIPAGTYKIGDTAPPRTTVVPEYFIDRFPVSNGEYSEFVKATNRSAPHYWGGATPSDAILDHPVAYVSFFDALEYVEWSGMRLPTEVEWDKAGSWDPRTERRRDYPWGDNNDKSLWNSSEKGIADTSARGTYSPQGDSAFGVGEMFGNIREWTGSLYDSSYAFSDKYDNQDRISPRVVRGGN